MAEKVEDTITDHQKHRIGIISATTPHHMDISYNSDLLTDSEYMIYYRYS